ncbi:MAG: nucleoside phosphorylase, partial [Clostridia bacterium]|nr:nucleoside phosphorylase [Clostridia bacterium]
LGRIKEKPVLVMSTGMGGPSTAIAVKELRMLGIRNLIRVGTCGGINTDVKAGDVIVVSGAVRQEGTSLQYVPVEYPAVADVDLVCALRDAANVLGYPCHVGIAQSKDSFYGQHDPGRMPVGYELQNKWEAWKKAGVLASEMEASTLFTVASVYGMKAGAILLCVWNQEREAIGLGNDEVHDMSIPIKIAIKAIKDSRFI